MENADLLLQWIEQPPLTIKHTTGLAVLLIFGFLEFCRENVYRKIYEDVYITFTSRKKKLLLCIFPTYNIYLFI